MVLQPHLTLPVEALNPGQPVQAAVGEDFDVHVIVAPGPVDESVPPEVGESDAGRLSGQVTPATRRSVQRPRLDTGSACTACESHSGHRDNVKTLSGR